MVYADGDMDRSVALVQVNLAVLKEFAASQNIQFSMDEELCANPACAAAVTSDLNRIGKGKLSALEVISTCHLISGEGSKTFPGDVFSPWNQRTVSSPHPTRLTGRPSRMARGRKSVVRTSRLTTSRPSLTSSRSLFLHGDRWFYEYVCVSHILFSSLSALLGMIAMYI